MVTYADPLLPPTKAARSACPNVVEKLADIQHDYRQEISASMHIHMTRKYCMEVIIVNGEVTHIRDLTERMMRLKGVEHVKLTSTANGEKLDPTDTLEHDHDHSH